MFHYPMWGFARAAAVPLGAPAPPAALAASPRRPRSLQPPAQRYSRAGGARKKKAQPSAKKSKSKSSTSKKLDLSKTSVAQLISTAEVMLSPPHNYPLAIVLQWMINHHADLAAIDTVAKKFGSAKAKAKAKAKMTKPKAKLAKRVKARSKSKSKSKSRGA